MFSLARNDEEVAVKMLGTLGNNSNDTFNYKVNICTNDNFTKNYVLSPDCARIYYLLGVLDQRLL